MRNGCRAGRWCPPSVPFLRRRYARTVVNMAPIAVLSIGPGRVVAALPLPASTSTSLRMIGRGGGARGGGRGRGGGDGGRESFDRRRDDRYHRSTCLWSLVRNTFSRSVLQLAAKQYQTTSAHISDVGAVSDATISVFSTLASISGRCAVTGVALLEGSREK